MSQGITARQSLWRRQVNFRLNLLYNKNAFVGYKLKVRHRQIVRRLRDINNPVFHVRRMSVGIKSYADKLLFPVKIKLTEQMLPVRL